MSNVYRVYLVDGATEVFEGKDIPKLLAFLQGEEDHVIYTIGKDKRLKWTMDSTGVLGWVHPIEELNQIMVPNDIIPFLDAIPLNILPRVIEVEKKRNRFYCNTLSAHTPECDQIVKDLASTYCSFLSDYKDGKLEGDIPIQIIKSYSDDLVGITSILKDIAIQRGSFKKDIPLFA